METRTDWKKTEFKGKQGYWLSLSTTAAIFAYPYKPRDDGQDGWDCLLLTGMSWRTLTRFRAMLPDSERHKATGAPRSEAHMEILRKACEKLRKEARSMMTGAQAAWTAFQETGDEPDEPEAVEPDAGLWYDPSRYVPAKPVPVTVAWTYERDGKSIRHGGDRTAYYKDGEWHWAAGGNDEISWNIRIDAWSACPARPKDWRKDA